MTLNVNNLIGFGQRQSAFQFIGAVTAFSTSNGAIDISGLPIRAGDIGIYFDYCRQGGGPIPTAVTPSGHSNKINSSGGFARAMVSTKVLTGSEGTIAGMVTTATSVNRKTYLVFRPVDPVSTITANDTAGQVTAGNPTGQTINAASTGSYPTLVIGQMCTSFASIDPRSVSPAMNEIENDKDSDLGQYVHWKLYLESASDHTYDMDDENEDNGLQSCYLTFS